MRTLKRAFDIVFSLLMLIVLSWLFALIILILLIKQGRPVFFVQKRVGKNEGAKRAEDLKCFEIYKFRTFYLGSVEGPSAKANPNEVTPVGRWLRKASLDELPQLVNILKGEMSFVGPRPLIPSEEEIKKMRLEAGVYNVKPGMTGLAQVNGRDDLSDEEKVRFDKEYVDNISLLLDLKILLKTVAAVLSGKGSN